MSKFLKQYGKLSDMAKVLGINPSTFRSKVKREKLHFWEVVVLSKEFNFSLEDFADIIGGGQH